MASYPTVSSDSRERALVAPIWHTVIFVLAAVALAGYKRISKQSSGNIQLKSRLPLYGTQILFELFIFAYVWLLGLKLKRTPLRELIGGKWSSAADVGRDFGAALVFWLLVVIVLSILQKLLGENTTGLQSLKALLPQTPLEMAGWVVLCATAGFCEELVFRGYLQRQFFAFTGRRDSAVALQAVIFGIAHVYQGTKGAIVISVYGALFGILAIMRKSLRPGMIQHAGQDIFSGIVGGILARRHYF